MTPFLFLFPFFFFFYSLFYVDTNFLITNLQIVLWIWIHTLIPVCFLASNIQVGSTIIILYSNISTFFKKSFNYFFVSFWCLFQFHSSTKARKLAGNYMFKFNNRKTRTRCEIFSKLTIKTPERRQWTSFWCLYC